MRKAILLMIFIICLFNNSAVFSKDIITFEDLYNKTVQIYLLDGSVRKGKVTFNIIDEKMGIETSDGNIFMFQKKEIKRILYRPHEDSGISLSILGCVTMGFAYYSIPQESYESHNGIRIYNDEEREDAKKRFLPVFYTGAGIAVTGIFLYIYTKDFPIPQNNNVSFQMLNNKFIVSWKF